MGTSYTDYGSVGFWTHDATLELWLYLLVAEIDADADPPAWIRQAREEWWRQATVGFVGHVSIDLDRHLLGIPERERDLLALVERVGARIAAFDPAIPAAVANGFGVGGGTEFRAGIETELLQRCNAAVAGTIRGTPTWETGDDASGVWPRR